MMEFTKDELRTIKNALSAAMAAEWSRMRSEMHKGPYYDEASARYNAYEALAMKIPGDNVKAEDAA